MAEQLPITSNNITGHRRNRMIRRTSTGFLLVVFILLLSACQKAASTPAQTEVAATMTPTTTITATTDTPTQTPAPSPIPPTAEPSLSPTPTEIPITELLFTGSIVPARCVQAAIDERGNADYIYESMRGVIEKAHIAIGTLNAALSDYPPRKGCVQTFVLVGESENADALARAGFDVMSVATNHIKNCGPLDCGNRAFFDTLANLRRVGIEPVGAGENLAEAMQPVVVTANGIRFGFISLGEIELSAFADKTNPGIAELSNANLRTAIENTGEVADVIIVLPHWGSDYSATPNYRQLEFAEVAVEAGAHLVVGNHAHVIQGMKEIDGVPVFFGLGSFVFDQSWSLETQQGIVVRITFEGTRFLSYEIIPVHIEKEGYVYIPGAEEAASILNRFQTISDQIP